MIHLELSERIRKSGVVAVVTVDDAEDAAPVARALYAGGISVIELTFRTRAAAEAVRRIRNEVPEVAVGAGTLLTRLQVEEAVAAGAAFGVAPGCNPVTIEAARNAGLPFAPGVMTPTDIEIAVMHECRTLKFFPAETSGGLIHLKTMTAPFAHLGIKFIPLGGIDARSLGAYLRAPFVLGVGGSWLADREAIRRKDWDGIRAKAREAASIVASRGDLAGG